MPAQGGANNTGAVFNLITRDGRQDKFLTAVDMLNQHMSGIRAARTIANAIAGDETNLPTAPTMAEIEQTHVMFLKPTSKPYIPVACEYSKQGSTTPATFGEDLTFEVPEFGDFIMDQMVRIKISGFGVQGAHPSTANTYRWAAFPGIRLLDTVRFTIGGAPIDDYDHIDMLFQSNFMLEGHKKRALTRMVGQQEERFATLYNPDEQVNQRLPFTDGPQTPKTYQPSLEIWAPLMFWHCLKPENGLSQRALPWGQRLITAKMATIEQMITAYAPGGTTKIPIPDDIRRQITIEAVELYTNNLFIGADIHDVYLRHIQFTMIRVHNRISTRVEASAGRKVLSGLKYATEFMYVGFRPTANNTPEDWASFVVQSKRQICVPAYVAVNPPKTGGGCTAKHQLVVRGATFSDEQLPIGSMAVTSSGIKIFEFNSARFYEDYLPYARSNTAVGLRGAFLVPFNLKTGESQPSGYLNLSRNRETYVEWTDALFNETNPADLIITSVAINYLVLKKGEGWVLYAT